MPNVTVTITIAEADVPSVVKAICNRAGVPVENVNAKPGLIALVRRWRDEEKKAETAIAEATLT